LLIYRLRNVSLVEVLLKQIGNDADIRLWALDAVAPELEDFTIGCGPGVRFENLNRLLAARPVKEDSWLVVADDDVFFARGGIRKMVAVMRSTGLSFAQPGHSLLSWWTCLFNISRPATLCRDTNYVEQGPLFVADPEFSKLIAPFPPWEGMGWGSSALWYHMKGTAHQIGIIDSCRVIHWSRANATYSERAELDRLEERLVELNIQSNWQLHSENRRWRSWEWDATRESLRI
jgi:hypothetical protein